MGEAAAWDLARQPGVEEVRLVDHQPDTLERAYERVANLLGRSESPAKLSKGVFDLGQTAKQRELLADFDVALSAADYRFNETLTRAAIEAKTHLCDLGGNLFVVERQLAMDEDARRAGVCVIPDCGLAPGMACLFAALAIEQLDTADTVRIRVGGLPANPKPPLNYKLVFSPRGLTNEYIEPAEVLRDGKILRCPSLTEQEPVEFPYPFGTLEAFHTSGGASTLPRTLRNRVRNLDYKTLRYPGHMAAFAGMQAIGLLSEEPVAGVVPRVLTEALLERALSDDDTDVVLARAEATGTLSGSAQTIQYEVIDHHDSKTGHSAMARTTSYPAAAVAYMLGAGAIEKRGVLPGELAVPLEAFLAAVRARGISVKETRS